MNWSFKKIGFILLMLCMVVGLAADNTVFVADGDLGTLRLFDSQGRALDASMGMTEVVDEGWILYNPESELLIITPLGNITLAQGSILIPTILRSDLVELYLVAGSGTFDSFGDAGTQFAVRTPASRYLLEDAGEIYVVSSDSEESVTAFFGLVDSYNKIYDTSTEMIPFEKLYMHLFDPVAEEIQRGYYLTYGTFPSVDQAYVAQADRSEALLVRAQLTVDTPTVEVAVVPTVVATEEIAPEPIETMEDLVIAVELEIEEVAPLPAPDRQVVLTTKEEPRKERGSIGLEAGYRFDWDGDKEFTHTLFAIPYFSFKSFELGAQIDFSTKDFSTFSYPFYPAPVGKLETVNYIFSHIHHLRFGRSDSWFHLDISESVRRDDILGSFFAPTFAPTKKLGLYNKIQIKSVSLETFIDDLRLANMFENKQQFVALSLTYTSAGKYPFSIGLGTLADVSRNTATNLYPTINARLPIVTGERVQFAAILEAQTYLPILPSIDWKQLFDKNIPHFFPNYLLGSGLALDVGPFHTKVTASMSAGMNRPFRMNEFSCADIGSYSNEDFNLTAELAWLSKHFETKLVWNFPLTKKFALATLDADPNKHADFSQFTVGLNLGSFTFDLGIQHIGVLGTIKDVFTASESVLSLLNGKYAQSFAQMSYRFGPAEVAVAARYPLNLAASPKVPEISVWAKIILDKRF